MRDLIEYIKLADKNNWDKLYPLIRDAYAEHIYKRISLTKTEPYLLSLDFHIIKNTIAEEPIEISYSLISSRFIKSNFTQEKKVDSNALENFILSKENDYNFDILFVLKIIENEDQRENFYRKLPLFGTLLTAFVTLVIGLLNLYVTSNLSKVVKSNSANLKLNIDSSKYKIFHIDSPKIKINKTY